MSSASTAGASTDDVDVMLTATNGTVTIGNTAGVSITAGANGSATVTVRGPIADPTLGLDEGDAARRLVSLLGSVVFPPAAVGAFVDFGSAKSNGCLALAVSRKQSPPAAEPSVGDVLDTVKDKVEGAGQKLLDLLTPNP